MLQNIERNHFRFILSYIKYLLPRPSPKLHTHIFPQISKVFSFKMKKLKSSALYLSLWGALSDQEATTLGIFFLNKNILAFFGTRP